MPARRSCARRLMMLAASAFMAVAALGVQAASNRSLYDRMGGAPVVRAFVSETIDRVVADPRLNSSFEGVNLPRLKRLLVEQICELAGGGCHYTGVSMREAHANQHITDAQFDGLVQILRDSMRQHHVRLRERNELLRLLAPMKRDVVKVVVPPPPVGAVTWLGHSWRSDSLSQSVRCGSRRLKRRMLPCRSTVPRAVRW